MTATSRVSISVCFCLTLLNIACAGNWGGQHDHKSLQSEHENFEKISSSSNQKVKSDIGNHVASSYPDDISLYGIGPSKYPNPSLITDNDKYFTGHEDGLSGSNYPPSSQSGIYLPSESGMNHDSPSENSPAYYLSDDYTPSHQSGSDFYQSASNVQLLGEAYPQSPPGGSSMDDDSDFSSGMESSYSPFLELNAVEPMQHVEETPSSSIKLSGFQTPDRVGVQVLVNKDPASQSNMLSAILPMIIHSFVQKKTHQSGQQNPQHTRPKPAFYDEEVDGFFGSTAMMSLINNPQQADQLKEPFLPDKPWRQEQQQTEPYPWEYGKYFRSQWDIPNENSNPSETPPYRPWDTNIPRKVVPWQYGKNVRSQWDIPNQNQNPAELPDQQHKPWQQNKPKKTHHPWQYGKLFRSEQTDIPSQNPPGKPFKPYKPWEQDKQQKEPYPWQHFRSQQMDIPGLNPSDHIIPPRPNRPIKPTRPRPYKPKIQYRPRISAQH